MGYLQKKENRNAAQARNSFVTRKAEQKLNALTDTFKTAAEHHYADERRDTLQRTLNFKDFRYLDNLRFVYNWENRFLSVNYNLQILSYIDVTEQFEEVGPCKFELEFSKKRHQNDRFICKDWKSKRTEQMQAEYLERLNNPLIIERVH